MVERSLENISFISTDFTTSRKPGKVGGSGIPTISICDIREVLNIYVKNILGEKDRKKANSRKVSYIEQFLTSSGFKKLKNARNSIRISIRDDTIRMERRSNMPINVWESKDTEDTEEDFTETRGDVETFVSKIHSWGECMENDRKYYLHMVFRYYMNRYHSKASKMGVVLACPSYQSILDILFPNGCATRFPSEFRRFLADTEGRTFKTETIPVPVKGSGTEVKYDYNFELISEVASMRKKISSTFIRWENLLITGKSIVYPIYLHVGDPGNIYISQAVSRANTSGVIRKAIGKLKNISSGMYGVLEECCEIGDIYMLYMERSFRSPGEQLKERIGFFMMSRTRKMFTYVKKHGVLDDIFENTDTGTENYVPFDNYCTADRQLLSVDRDENTCRSLLMLLVDVSFMFYTLKNEKLGDMDPSSIVEDTIKGFDK